MPYLDTSTTYQSWSVRNPHHSRFFGLGSKRLMVMVQVITVGEQPTMMDPKHRCIGQ
jgi:hypothetical protein